MGFCGDLIYNGRMRGGIFALLVGVLTLGCSDDGSDGGSGDIKGMPSSADAALASQDCYLGLVVDGVSSSGIACSGTQQSTVVTLLRESSFEAAMRVNLDLQAAPQAGELALQRLTVDVPEGATNRKWEAPEGACTAIASEPSLEPDLEWLYFRIDVSCSESAQPVGDNPGQPLELGEFTLVSFFTTD